AGRIRVPPGCPQRSRDRGRQGDGAAVPGPAPSRRQPVRVSSKSPVREKIATPQTLHNPAQGRAAHPGMGARARGQSYAEGVAHQSPGSRSAPWEGGSRTVGARFGSARSPALCQSLFRSDAIALLHLAAGALFWGEWPASARVRVCRLDAPDDTTKAGKGHRTRTRSDSMENRTMKRAALALVALLLAPMPAVRAADVTIVRTFSADKGPGYRKPVPDAAGAVGPHHAVVLDDRAFVA